MTASGVAAPLFDRFVFIDWSASSRRKSGKDSIWIADSDVRGLSPCNVSTRSQAVATMRTLLGDAVGSGQRVLVGFDFAYGYPRGFADSLGLGSRAEPWREVWDELARLVNDHADNQNNRFRVADELNRRVSGGPGPFWGRPPSATGNFLLPTKGDYWTGPGPGASLEEYRVTERYLRARSKQVHSVWKLSGSGAVGSQTLVGIPHLRELRDDPELRNASRVWPFETGFSAPVDERSLILLAGPVFTDSRYNRYFYAVPPESATANRPAYEPGSGYAGMQFIVALSRRFPKFWIGGFARYDTLHGAAFEASPLVTSKRYAAGGIGISWILGESSRRVAAEAIPALYPVAPAKSGIHP